MRKRMLFGLSSMLLICASAIPSLAQRAPVTKAATTEPAACTVSSTEAVAKFGPLPSTYDDLLRVPQAGRHIVFAHLPAETKALLWSTHMDRFLNGHPELSAEQRALLLEASDLAGRPGTLRHGSRHLGWKISVEQPLTRLLDKARRVFSSEEMRMIFTGLGEDQPEIEKPLGQPSPRFKVIATATNCTCSSDSDWCPGRLHCSQTNCKICNGCGTLWLFPCDGTC